MSKSISLSKICAVCGRGYMKSAIRSHSNISTLTRQQVNLQSRKVGGKRVRVCTRCIKTEAKVRA